MIEKVTRSRSDESKVLVRFIEETKDFEGKVHGYELDQEYEANDGQVLYSIDTDMIAFFLDPLEMGANRNDPETAARLRTGYSHIFRSDPDELAGVIGNALSEAMFFRNTGQNQAPVEARHLLVFPGVDQEIVQAIDSILTSSIKEIRRAEGGLNAEERARILQDLKKLEGDALYEEVARKLPQLYKFFWLY